MNATHIPLITEEQRAELLANGAVRSRGQDHDPVPVVKLHTLDAHATWLLTELDPTDGDTAYGLCDVGIGMPQLDHIKLSVLATIRGPNDLPVRRDPHFVARFPLSEYLRRAQEAGSIND